MATNQELAEAQAILRYTGAINALERDRKRAEINYNTNKEAIDKYGVSGKEAITGAWTQGLGNLRGNADQVNADLATQVDQVGRGYRDATAVMEATKADQLARMRALAQSLGGDERNITETGNQVLDLVGQITGQNAMNDATTTGNLRTWAAQNAALMQGGIQQAEREQADSHSRFQTALMQALADAQNQWANADLEYGGRLSDIQSERGAFQVDAMRQLNEADWQKSLAEAQMQLERDKAARAIEAANADRAAAGSRAAAGDALDWAKFQAALNQDQRDYEWQYQRDARDAALARDELNWRMGQVDQQEQRPYAGLEGLQRYAEAAGINPNQSSYIQALLDRAANSVNTAPENDPMAYQDPVYVAMDEWRRNQNLRNAVAERLPWGFGKGTSGSQARSMMEILAGRYYGG